MTATRALVERALARVAEADGRPLDAVAGRSFFDFAACVQGGRGALDAAWADPAGRLALEAHALDRDDLHAATLTHPGGIVWPAVLAAGRAASGRQAVAAAALGYEVVTAVATLLGRDARRHWHVAALAGAPGAAAAAASVSGAGADVVTAAAGHALSVAGGSIQCMLERSGTRLLHRAHAVRSGLDCAGAASAGLGATRRGLESPNGLLAAVGSDVDPWAEPPGGTPALAATSLRPWAATGFAQAAVDAALELGPLPADDVAAVSISLSAGGAALAGNLRPETNEEAWWSVAHAACVALVAGGEALERGLTSDPAVTALLGRCTVTAGRADLGADLEVELRSGARRTATVPFALGHPSRPLSDEQQLLKWRRVAAGDGTEALERCLAIADYPFAELADSVLGRSD
ncbi:MAG: MmgE/PrpD family protein [Gaiellaceae bacterium]